MKKILLTGVILTASLFSANVFAADIAAGKAKSALCAACHGANGKTANPLWPNLAGQNDAYLAKQIKDFRDGVRKDASMAPMVANLTDDDIANLAAYYASLK
ncbi:MAG: cytochrome c [Proteobacteria bacterium]|nr:cytochrome c [Pseudomonadota bacterium]